MTAKMSTVSFYSILVRLKGELPAKPFLVLDMFLFHTGSIKRMISQMLHQVWLGFYSILVRLKVATDAELTAATNGCFYSILVRLKA